MSIFSVEVRNDIHTKMLEIGIKLIKEKSMQKITVSEIAYLTGIGKGTFYHFFKSKEQYFYDLIHYSKNNIYMELNKLIEDYKVIKRSNFCKILEKYSGVEKNNIINFISIEDEQWLAKKLSIDTVCNSKNEIDIITKLLKYCSGVKKNINYLVIANMMKIMALVVQNRELLHKEVLELNIKLLQEELLNYVFGAKNN